MRVPEADTPHGCFRVSANFLPDHFIAVNAIPDDRGPLAGARLRVMRMDHSPARGHGP
jgi:hypothetical protein